MNLLLSLILPLAPFGLFLEGMTWSRFHITSSGRLQDKLLLTEVSDPTQVGPLRSDPSHYDEMGRYLWWGC